MRKDPPATCTTPPDALNESFRKLDLIPPGITLVLAGLHEYSLMTYFYDNNFSSRGTSIYVVLTHDFPHVSCLKPIGHFDI